jgi:hypothetical protein
MSYTQKIWTKELNELSKTQINATDMRAKCF